MLPTIIDLSGFFDFGTNLVQLCSDSQSISIIGFVPFTLNATRLICEVSARIM